MTSFVLGTDVLVLLVVLSAFAALALVLGGPALRAAPALPEAETRMMRQINATITAVTAWVAVPAAAFLLLVPAIEVDLVVRSAGVLLGAALTAAVAQGALVAHRAGRSGRIIPTALAVAATLTVPTLAVLREASADALFGATVGSAIAGAVVLGATALVSTAGTSSALLGGSAEQDRSRYGTDNPGHLHLARAASMRTAAMPAVLAMLAALVSVSATSMVGVSVLGVEAIVVALLGHVVALAVSLVISVVPRRAPQADDGGRRSVLGALLPASVGVVATIIAAAMVVPARYAQLRFDEVGMGAFTDPAIAGAGPLPRATLLDQLEAVETSLSEFVSMTDESRGATAFLDVIGLYSTSPRTSVIVALLLGGMLALASLWLARATVSPSGSAARAVARTSRTGASLGLLTALGAAGLRAGIVLLLLAITIYVLMVLGAGIAQLVLTLMAIAALVALVVASGAGTMALRAQDDSLAAQDARAEMPGVLVGLISLALATPATLIPMVTLVASSQRGASLWEDRILHAFTPTSGAAMAGAGLAVVAVMLAFAAVTEGARRIGAESVVLTRAALAEDLPAAHLDSLGYDLRRSVLPMTASGLLLVLVVLVGFGPAALPSFVLVLIATSVSLGVVALLADALHASALHVIEEGRYGGLGGWAHTSALGNSALMSTLSPLAVAAAVLGTAMSFLAVLSTSLGVSWVLGDVDAILLWGLAGVALIIVGALWAYLVSSAQPNLEDQLES